MAAKHQQQLKTKESNFTMIEIKNLLFFSMATMRIRLFDAFPIISPQRSAFIMQTTSSPILPSRSRVPSRPHSRRQHPTTNPLFVYAPPGSGYISSEEEVPDDTVPETYKPTMGYPGTMRPGEMPEDQPYSSLPVADYDPDPVPWPHFQEIEWHHNWGSPHPHPIRMEDFIEMHGRWATAEMEAEVRKGARRGVRERRELEEAQKSASFILDDDDDDDDEVDGVAGGAGAAGVKLDLGEDMDVDLLIGSEMGTSDVETSGSTTASEVIDAEVEEEDVDDDFLLSLGLDGGEDDAPSDGENKKVEEESSDDDFLLSLGIVPGENDSPSGDEGNDGDEPAFALEESSTDGILEAMQNMLEAEEGGKGTDLSVDELVNFDDLDLGSVEDGEGIGKSGKDGDADFALDMIEDGEDSIVEEQDQMVNLDDMIGNEDKGDDDAFDDGGFDYD